LLTGLLPWTHRAVGFFDPILDKDIDRSIFNQFKEDYFCLGYTHNSLVDIFLRQFIPFMDKYIPRQDLFLRRYWVSKVFPNDFDIAFVGTLNAIEDRTLLIKSSVYLSEIYTRLYEPLEERAAAKYAPQFPRDLPNIRGKYFLLETSTDWLLDNLKQVGTPFIGYFHFFPPHSPYNTRKEFINIYFKDNYHPVEKELHLFGDQRNVGRVDRERRLYDEYINYADFEFDRLMRGLQSQGILDNTWIVLTTDHGEMFERGIIGHMEESLHQPLVNIPLVIFPPGGGERVDITTNTSAVDVLPTLMQIAGKPLPEVCEGLVLPPFNLEAIPPDRPVYCMRAFKKEPLSPFTRYTLMMIKDKFKIVYYDGYNVLPDHEPMVEFFNLENDPEELNNLVQVEPVMADQLVQELLEKFNSVEDQYR
jgi:arylsulfatase A-like enzyme